MDSITIENVNLQWANAWDNVFLWHVISLFFPKFPNFKCFGAWVTPVPMQVLRNDTPLKLARWGPGSGTLRALVMKVVPVARALFARRCLWQLTDPGSVAAVGQLHRQHRERLFQEQLKFLYAKNASQKAVKCRVYSPITFWSVTELQRQTEIKSFFAFDIWWRACLVTALFLSLPQGQAAGRRKCWWLFL